MIGNRIRAGSLAIARNGKLVYAKGFTWAESGYPVTQATTRFRYASVSKAMTSIAMMQLLQKGSFGRAGLTTSVQSILNVRTPSGALPVDARWSQIKLDNLLCQASGVSGGASEPMTVAAYGKDLPMTKSQWVGYVAGQGMNATPGTMWDYQNVNFTMLGQVIEKKTATGYGQAVLDNVMTPLGLTRPRLGRSLAANRLAGEALYDTPAGVNDGGQVAVRGVIDAARTRTAYSYGGFNLAPLDAAGGWVMAPADAVKVLSSFDDGSSPLMSNATRDKMWSTCNLANNPDAQRGWYTSSQALRAGGTATAHEHNGGYSSTATLLIRRDPSADDSGLTISLAFNNSVHNGLHGFSQGAALFAIANAYAPAQWPTTDLFPSVGIPANS
jgi:CubicO group peptidase (beta-lactamase class C family)